jgi:DNA-binding CsgD family transcriptional regulator
VREFVAGLGERKGAAALVVTGEAGAGKTTLWRAGAEAATAAGCRVLRSEASASEADLAFTGLYDLLSGVLPAVAGDIPGPQREALEIALLLRPARAEPLTAGTTGLAVLAALRSLLADAPLLVAIDDAQWLDVASLDALAFALRRITGGPLSLLLTARTDAVADPRTLGDPPPPQGWRSLPAALPDAAEIELGPLDPGQIQLLLPDTVSAAQARLIAEQSRGNPFWVAEIAGGHAAVSPLVRGLASGRECDAVSRSAAEAAAVVAAAGHITVPEAVTVLGRLGRPATALDEAVLAGVVVERGDLISPAHPLIGAAAVQGLPPARRADVYRQLAAISASAERHAHFAALAAGPVEDAAIAAALDAAAAAAHGRGANAAAGEFAARAVAYTPGPDQAALARRRIRAGELLCLAGEMARSLDQFEALDTARLSTDDLERVVPLMLDTANLVRGRESAAGIGQQVAAAVGPDPRRQALVWSLAADISYGFADGRREAALTAIRYAEAAGAAANHSLHRALLNLVMVKVTRGEGLDTGLLDRAARLEPGLSAELLYDTAELHHGLWSRFTDDLDVSRTTLRRLIDRAADSGKEWGQQLSLCYLASTEVLAGDFGAARAALDTRAEIASWHDFPQSPWQLEPHCEVLIAAGELDRALSVADECLPDQDATADEDQFVGQRIRGLVSMWREAPETAVPHLERAVTYAERCGWTDPSVRGRVDALLAEAYVALGRTDEPKQISEWLREHGQRLGRPSLTGDAERIYALAAAAAGDLDVAAAAASAAVAAHEASRLRVELARSLLVLGQIERRRRARGAARDALSRARELAVAMGHQPLLALVGRELPRVAAARSGTGLTGAEQRVADQLAAGATNREAAAALFVSVRTVETHVASIYRKLGVRTRSELRRALAAR